MAGSVASLREGRKSSQDKEKNIREILNDIQERSAELREKRTELREKRAGLEKPGKGLRFYSLVLHPLAEQRENFRGVWRRGGPSWNGLTPCMRDPTRCSIGLSENGGMYVLQSTCFQRWLKKGCYSRSLI